MFEETTQRLVIALNSLVDNLDAKFKIDPAARQAYAYNTKNQLDTHIANVANIFSIPALSPISEVDAMYKIALMTSLAIQTLANLTKWEAVKNPLKLKKFVTELKNNLNTLLVQLDSGTKTWAPQIKDQDSLDLAIEIQKFTQELKKPSLSGKALFEDTPGWLQKIINVVTKTNEPLASYIATSLQTMQESIDAQTANLQNAKLAAGFKEKIILPFESIQNKHLALENANKQLEILLITLFKQENYTNTDIQNIELAIKAIRKALNEIQFSEITQIKTEIAEQKNNFPNKKFQVLSTPLFDDSQRLIRFENKDFKTAVTDILKKTNKIEKYAYDSNAKKQTFVYKQQTSQLDNLEKLCNLLKIKTENRSQNNIKDLSALAEKLKESKIFIEKNSSDLTDFLVRVDIKRILTGSEKINDPAETQSLIQEVEIKNKELHAQVLSISETIAKYEQELKESTDREKANEALSQDDRNEYDRILQDSLVNNPDRKTLESLKKNISEYTRVLRELNQQLENLQAAPKQELEIKVKKPLEDTLIPAEDAKRKPRKKRGAFVSLKRKEKTQEEIIKTPPERTVVNSTTPLPTVSVTTEKEDPIIPDDSQSISPPVLSQETIEEPATANSEPKENLNTTVKTELSDSISIKKPIDDDNDFYFIDQVIPNIEEVKVDFTEEQPRNIKSKSKPEEEKEIANPRIIKAAQDLLRYKSGLFHTRGDTVKWLRDTILELNNPLRAAKFLFNYYQAIPQSHALGKNTSQLSLVLEQAMLKLLRIRKFEFDNALGGKKVYRANNKIHIEHPVVKLFRDKIEQTNEKRASFKEPNPFKTKALERLGSLCGYLVSRESSFKYKVVMGDVKIEMDLKLNFARQLITYIQSENPSQKGLQNSWKAYKEKFTQKLHKAPDSSDLHRIVLELANMDTKELVSKPSDVHIAHRI